jgi:hypothetical protein
MPASAQKCDPVPGAAGMGSKTKSTATRYSRAKAEILAYTDKTVRKGIVCSVLEYEKSVEKIMKG